MNEETVEKRRIERRTTQVNKFLEVGCQRQRAMKSSKAGRRPDAVDCFWVAALFVVNLHLEISPVGDQIQNYSLGIDDSIEFPNEPVLLTYREMKSSPRG